MSEQRYDTSEEFRANVRAATRQQAIRVFTDMARDYFRTDESQLVIRIFSAGVDRVETTTASGEIVTHVLTYEVDFGAVMRVPVT